MTPHRLGMYRMFYVTLQGKKSKWKRQNNDLPQGSVLAQLFCNIYTNNQPMSTTTRHFLYVDDLAIAAQGGNFEKKKENN